MIKIETTPVISITTKAYNVEKYIKECADSILNQSFTNFEWIVVDNGSTDETSKILEEYARKDKRIKLFRNERNTVIYNEPNNHEYSEHIRNLKSEYWCMVDSDDYLHVDFLKELYTAAKKYNADIAVGGTEMFNDENPQLCQLRCPPNFYTHDITSLGDILPQIYGCFRPIWGKLFRTSLIEKQRRYRSRNPIKPTNGSDTIFCIDFLNISSSVIGTNKALHYYRIRKTSHYYSNVDKARYLNHKIIYHESKKLLQKWDRLNDENSNFIAQVLYTSIKDCMYIAANAVSVHIEDRLEVIETILSDEFVYKVFLKAGLLNNLFVDIQKIVDFIMENIKGDDELIATTHYVYRLYKSIKMGTSSNSNKQNAFLMYISSICDENNKNRFGTNLLYSFFSIIKKKNLDELRKSNIRSEFLVSNPVLFRDIINLQFDNVVAICEENAENADYNLLNQALRQYNFETNIEWVLSSKNLIEKYISEENFNNAAELVLRVLDYCPLDKEALCYKLYLLTVNGDIITALETAEVLTIFYPEDSTALMLAGQVFTWASFKDKARKVFKKALDVCTSKRTFIEIKRELEAI